MSTISASTTSTTAFKITTDTTGALVFQTGASPTTAMTLGSDQSVTFAGTPTYSGGTANGVAYLNGSKVLTTGIALVFDGSNLGVGVTPSAWKSNYKAQQTGNAAAIVGRTDNNNNYFSSNWYVNSSNQDIYQNTGYATLYSQGTGVHAWYNAPSGTAGNAISFTQAMTLDIAGNLGLGVTPSAWGSASRALQMQSGMSLFSNTSGLGGVGNNVYSNPGTGDYYIANGYASRYYQYQGTHVWNTAASGTAGNTIAFTQAMTLNASGNLGIGTTSPNARLHLNTSGSSIFLTLQCAGGYGYLFNDGTYLSLASDIGSTGIKFLVARAAPDNAATIDSGGNVLVNVTSAPINASRGLYVAGLISPYSNYSPASNIGGQIAFAGAQGSPVCGRVFMGDNTGWQWEWGPYGGSGWIRRFYFTDAGSAYSTTGTWGTISDARLKENIVDATPKLSDVMRLRVRNFNFITEPNNKQLGFIAQEVEEVFPRAVDETRPDDDGNTTKSVKTTVLIPILVKAIQEQQAIITQLTSRIETLEAA